MQWQYQALMTVYSNCDSSLTDALITGLWFYIVPFIFQILLLYISKYIYAIKLQILPLPFSGHFFLSHSPAYIVGMRKQSPLKSAALSAVQEAKE